MFTCNSSTVSGDGGDRWTPCAVWPARLVIRVPGKSDRLCLTNNDGRCLQRDSKSDCPPACAPNHSHTHACTNVPVLVVTRKYSCDLYLFYLNCICITAYKLQYFGHRYWFLFCCCDKYHDRKLRRKESLYFDLWLH